LTSQAVKIMTLTPTVYGFKLQFPEFNAIADGTVQLQLDTAQEYVSNQDYGYITGNKRIYAINLVAAHLLKISLAIASGQPIQAVLSATEGAVTVNFVPPPVKNGWQWWLNATPYGQSLLAMLSAASAGGWYAGAASNRAGIRKPNGTF